MWPFRKRNPAATWADVARIKLELDERNRLEDALFDEWWQQNKHSFGLQPHRVITGGKIEFFPGPSDEQMRECEQYIAERVVRHG